MIGGELALEALLVELEVECGHDSGIVDEDMKGDVAGEEGLGIGGDGVGLGEIEVFHNGGCDAKISQGLLGALHIAGGDKHLRTLFEEDADSV